MSLSCVEQVHNNIRDRDNHNNIIISNNMDIDDISVNIILSDSTLCRLCGISNISGTSLYTSHSSSTSAAPLATLLNHYLPLKVREDDGLPRTICPGCNIQLEATAQFMDLVIEGQAILRNLLKAQNEAIKKAQKDAALHDETEIIVQILDDGTLYSAEHPLTLRVQGIDKPKRKRGRPTKPPKIDPPPPPPQEEAPPEEIVDGTKRRRKAPKRYHEAVQGKELERIFREEGVIDGNESDGDVENDKQEIVKNDTNPTLLVPEIIGHMESNDGTNLGQLVILNNGTNRGRPKGCSRGSRQTCNICSIQFTSTGRYMAHVAAHHAQDLLKNNEIVGQSIETVSGPGENMPNIEFVEDQFIEVAEKIVSEQIVNNDNQIFITIPEKSLENDKMENMHIEILEENVIKDLNLQNEQENIEPIVVIEVNSTEGVKYKCSKCNKMFNSKQSCTVHLKTTHLGQRAFKCDHCEKTFPYKINLKHHMNIHFPKGDKGYACDLCGKILNHPSSVVYHKEAEHNNGKRFICNKCGRSFKHRQLLRRHQLVHSENRPFTCKICQGSFKTRANLLNHQVTHTGIKKFSCEICMQKFAHKNGLTLHMRCHSGLKPFKCTLCDKAFNQNGNLTEHMRIHTGEKPYHCTICQKKFTTSSQYKLHLQRHSGERPYHCQDCDKRFMQKETWKSHIRRHKGERPYSCNVCSRTFIERWALKKHFRIHSGERPYSCNVCGRAFTDCSNLTKHKKIHRDENMSKNTVCIPGPTVESEDSQVVYITYPAVEDDDDIPTFHIINRDSSIKDFSTCLYDAESGILTENAISIESDPNQENEKKTSDGEITTTIIDQVLDQAGNPLHLTMEDGTQLAITSSDGGKSLQVTTEDGQTIPVQFETKEDDIILKDDNIILTNEIVESVSEELIQPIKVVSPNGQTVRLLSTLDDPNLSQYFTFSGV